MLQLLKQLINVEPVMPFVKRDLSGNIVGVSQEQTPECSEEVEKNDPLFHEFLVSVSQDQQLMTESDLDFVRVVEDLVDLLISNNYIQFTDLPDKAQEKMSRRQALRGKLKTHLDLLGDEDSEGFF